MRPGRLSVLAPALALLAASCGSNGSSGEGEPTGSAGGMVAVVASADLYANAPQRFAVGLPFADGRLVSFGSVEFLFSYTGTAEQSIAPEPGPEATASYVPTPGTPDGGRSGPVVTQPSEARGVYEAGGVTFDAAGIWQVEVTADVQGPGTQTARASFSVAAVPSLPAPGQPALKTENLTIRSKDAPLGAIDSRADLHGKIPDPELHRWTIARAIEEHRPALVVFATPVYCVSRFCGPVTDLVVELAKRYDDRAVFIHVEIWRDFQDQVINRAAADWLLRNDDLTEPWLYLIGADGTILDRWASLFAEDEVAEALRQLPVTRP
ncbi:MAG: hypothetical protein ACRDH0_07005 [Actinomycetota bacterium]